MKIFHCDHCGQLLFFENTTCLKCGHQVAYVPNFAGMTSLDPPLANVWQLHGGTYRLCSNYTEQQICNWAVPADDPNPLCISCRTTRAIPNLFEPGHREAWYRLEAAKRRVLFTLTQLSLPILDLIFEFKAGEPGSEVLTGHSNGVITINIAEADDVERERQKKAVHEPYRSVIGHIRHEVGHFYWGCLIARTSELSAFRNIFGDEEQDYSASLRAHYEQGANPNWQDRFVSAYASVHPWEDWAETWTHYLHMVDALETAAACGISMFPARSDEPSMSRVPSSVPPARLAFSSMLDHWFPLTYALNNLNRGLGLPDAYPFVLSPMAIAKLQFVHDVIGRVGGFRAAVA
jgi:hypothetical protein